MLLLFWLGPVSGYCLGCGLHVCSHFVSWQILAQAQPLCLKHNHFVSNPAIWVQAQPFNLPPAISSQAQLFCFKHNHFVTHLKPCTQGLPEMFLHDGTSQIHEHTRTIPNDSGQISAWFGGDPIVRVCESAHPKQSLETKICVDMELQRGSAEQLHKRPTAERQTQGPHPD